MVLYKQTIRQTDRGRYTGRRTDSTERSLETGRHHTTHPAKTTGQAQNQTREEATKQGPARGGGTPNSSPAARAHPGNKAAEPGPQGAESNGGKHRGPRRTARRERGAQATKRPQGAQPTRARQHGARTQRPPHPIGRGTAPQNRAGEEGREHTGNGGEPERKQPSHARRAGRPGAGQH